MKLKKIKLANYRQHKDLEIDFSGNMIAVVGRNGSGKSNFLGAIQFALTGEQPGFNKEDLLNWEAAKSGEGGYVDLEFVHNGMECRIQRRIEKPAVTLMIGWDKFSGTKKVQEAMETILHIDKDVLRQSVFVRQTEVESVLFDDPRERELAFQKLVGLGDAAKHNKFLTDFLAALAEPKNMADEIERQRKLIEEQKKALADLEARSAGRDETIRAAGDEDTIRKDIRVLQSRIPLVETVLCRFSDMDSANANYESVKEKYEAHSLFEVVDVTELANKCADLKSRIATAEREHLENKARKNAEAYLSLAKKDLEKIPADWEARMEEYQSTQKAVNELRGRSKQLQKLLADAPLGNVCPLCGSTVDHNIKAEIQNELDGVNREVGEKSTWLRNNEKVTEFQRMRDKAEADVKMWETRVKELGPEVGEIDMEWLRRELASATDKLNAANTSNNTAATAKAAMSEALKRVENAESALYAAMDKIPGGYRERGDYVKAGNVMKDRMEVLLAGLSALSDLRKKKAELDGGISQTRSFIEEAERGLADLERVNAENEVKARKIQVVRDVKDWFSYKNGPRVMSKAVMGMLVDETNKFLGQFGAPFVVTPVEEGMGFRCVFTDGRVVSSPPPEATMLSGGQKIALAVAFRFAVYMMFAGKLGLLSLDEPTAYLDDETIARFADLLGKIRQTAQNLDIQVLISTHETALAPAMDQTVTIGA